MPIVLQRKFPPHITDISQPTMQPLILSYTTLAFLAYCLAAPAPAPEDTITVDFHWWPRADITNPSQLVYCTDASSTKTCKYPEARADGGNGGKPDCLPLGDMTGISSLSPGIGLNCTLFARDKCDPGPYKRPLGGSIFFSGYKDARTDFYYPGRGNFADAGWIDMGFQSNDYKGKPPRSMSCIKRK
jgi:hypothetical protein